VACGSNCHARSTTAWPQPRGHLRTSINATGAISILEPPHGLKPRMMTYGTQTCYRLCAPGEYIRRHARQPPAPAPTELLSPQKGETLATRGRGLPTAERTTYGNNTAGNPEWLIRRDGRRLAPLLVEERPTPERATRVRLARHGESGGSGRGPRTPGESALPARVGLHGRRDPCRRARWRAHLDEPGSA
jgi:hypothetical protein